MEQRFLFIDSEVDGLPIIWKGKNARRPMIIKLTWALFNENGKLIDHDDSLMCRPGGLLIQTKKITGISNKLLLMQGKDREEVLCKLLAVMETVDHIVSYNLNYELGMLENEVGKAEVKRSCKCAQRHCLMKQGLVRERSNDHIHDHYMSLGELYFSLFHEPINLKRTPLSEVAAMARCFFEINNKRKWIID